MTKEAILSALAEYAKGTDALMLACDDTDNIYGCEPPSKRSRVTANFCVPIAAQNSLNPLVDYDRTFITLRRRTLTSSRGLNRPAAGIINEWHRQSRATMSLPYAFWGHQKYAVVAS